MYTRSGLTKHFKGRQKKSGHFNDIAKSIELDMYEGSELVDACVRTQLLQDHGSMVLQAKLIVKVATASGMPFGKASMILRAYSIFKVCIMHT
jgi:hypothetical protein